MFTVSLSLVLSFVFLILSSIHFYWLFGGNLWLDRVIPTKENQDTVIKIPLIATLFSGLFMLAFSAVCLLGRLFVRSLVS